MSGDARFGCGEGVATCYPSREIDFEFKLETKEI